MIRYTVDDIMNEKPCMPDYPRKRVEALWAGREGLTPREIAALDIQIYDRIWALSRMLYRTSPNAAYRIARMFALSVTHRWDCPDLAWWYLVSGDEAARDAARDDAWEVHCSAKGASSDAALATWDATIESENVVVNASIDARWSDDHATWADTYQQHLETLVGAWEVHP